MIAHRPTARGVLFLTLIALLCAGGAAATRSAAAVGAKVPQLIFPVLGESSYGNDFGDARGQGSHEGNDIMAAKRSLALAAEAGRVKFWTTSARAGCMLYLEGASGTEYLYIHLNDDLTKGNDNSGGCVPGVSYAKGLKNGDKVAAGEPVGFVGDSGDANGGASHLHFEVHPGGGAATNPYPHLRKARRLLFSAAQGSTFTLALTGTIVATETEGLQLKLARVRSWPGGRLVHQSGEVGVAVPLDTSIEGIGGAAGALPPGVEALEAGSSVTVWTAPAKVTLAAQTGAKGALSAARVVVKN